MSQQSLGLIETIGLTAAVAAADAAVKSAHVTLVGYELSKGDGMAVVKLRGDVGSVTAAVAAATAAAELVGQVVATRIIARPVEDLTCMIDSRDTVGVARVESPAPAVEIAAVAPTPSAEPEPEQPEPIVEAASDAIALAPPTPEPEPEPEPEPVIEPPSVLGVVDAPPETPEPPAPAPTPNAGAKPGNRRGGRRR